MNCSQIPVLCTTVSSTGYILFEKSVSKKPLHKAYQQQLFHSYGDGTLLTVEKVLDPLGSCLVVILKRNIEKNYLAR